jgi:hypothetical protein
MKRSGNKLTSSFVLNESLCCGLDRPLLLFLKLDTTVLVSVVTSSSFSPPSRDFTVLLLVLLKKIGASDMQEVKVKEVSGVYHPVGILKHIKLSEGINEHNIIGIYK